MDSKAVAVLQKFGWVEGKGLGKSESGVVESIKVARKSNTKGLGEKGAHWGNDWWDRMYSTALDNIDNKDSGEKSAKPKESLVYGSFTKAKSLSTMLDESGESDYESSEDVSEESKETQRKQNSTHHMDDSSVFEACNGIILRKFIPTGKLERLAQQEQQWKQKAAQNSVATSPVATPDTNTKKSKKRKRKSSPDDEEAPRKRQKKEGKSKKSSKEKKKSKKEKRTKSHKKKKSKKKE
eukprot:CAMPEP_0206193586 /NCGR_PEP_ID=MMETSP0166-20121206/6660_1 /ASSEMBLY_ACC=CAM_ASM_000260 /TAXON_ID=95228 /ORGANISM="Vannella robusta, Strain DIVA3 518/3/11/1/6" /LENGTH=237 /DNA_ID=CAMNT_0053610337 /DNA_START=342 /DNA_END=1055 /DNA_ORIENTATION=+